VFKRVASSVHLGKDLKPDLLREASTCQEVLHGLHLPIAKEAVRVVLEPQALHARGHPTSVQVGEPEEEFDALWGLGAPGKLTCAAVG
jgi:hypothetical protein